MIGVRNKAFSRALAVPSWRGLGAHLIDANELWEIAEQSGLSAGLCAWTLRQAAKDASSWPDQISVVVDLSPSQWTYSGLGLIVAGALATSGLPAERLCLRISGAGRGEEGSTHFGILHELKARGISFTRADFGSGADALNELIAFPYDHIVIGDTFVAEIAQRAQCATIVAAMTGFAASLGIATIAEGVTTSEQFEILRAAGCTLFEGPFIGPSCAAAELAAPLARAEVA
jgi:EAL domain-containing protein (putative c-di-GMP-specific phosphodiesterase class I)